jgi:hypothetical protein
VSAAPTVGWFVRSPWLPESDVGTAVISSMSGLPDFVGGEMVRPGRPGQDVPAEFGSWQPLWKRHCRRSTSGTYQRSSNARWSYKTRLARWSGCYRSTRTPCEPIRTSLARHPRWASSNDEIPEPDNHRLARSRSGLTTKVHALTDRGVRSRPRDLTVPFGQVNAQVTGLHGTRVWTVMTFLVVDAEKTREQYLVLTGRTDC